MNTFAYAPNPVGWIDPYGLNKTPVPIPPGTPLRTSIVVALDEDDADFTTARAARRAAMRQSGLPTSRSYSSTMEFSGYDKSDRPMFVEKITYSGNKTPHTVPIFVHPQGHYFAKTDKSPANFEKPHYHGTALDDSGDIIKLNGHKTYDTGNPRPTNQSNPANHHLSCSYARGNK